MLRRTLLLSAAALALPTRAQVIDLSDAINKAGRQRMLSQRMGKAWLSIAQGVEPESAKRVLDTSLALFDRQLVELKAYAPNSEISDTYLKLEAAWGSYKTALVGSTPDRSRAASLLATDAQVLALAHQGTVQYEAALGKPAGKLVNIAGRQRMLSQRMAKFYFAAALPVDADKATAEMGKARTEFIGAQDLLRQAPEATARIKESLQLADGQWVFFDAALQRMQNASRSAKSGAEVFVASENLLSVMDAVTGLYAAVKT